MWQRWSLPGSAERGTDFVAVYTRHLVAQSLPLTPPLGDTQNTLCTDPSTCARPVTTLFSPHPRAHQQYTAASVVHNVLGQTPGWATLGLGVRAWPRPAPQAPPSKAEPRDDCAALSVNRSGTCRRGTFGFYLFAADSCPSLVLASPPLLGRRPSIVHKYKRPQKVSPGPKTSNRQVSQAPPPRRRSASGGRTSRGATSSAVGGQPGRGEHVAGERRQRRRRRREERGDRGGEGGRG